MYILQVIEQELKLRNGDGIENGKKAIGLISKTLLSGRCTTAT